jgi:hypothetical protein
MKKYCANISTTKAKNIAAKSPDKTRKILMLQIENNIRLVKKNTQTNYVRRA